MEFVFDGSMQNVNHPTPGFFTRTKDQKCVYETPDCPMFVYAGIERGNHCVKPCPTCRVGRHAVWEAKLDQDRRVDWTLDPKARQVFFEAERKAAHQRNEAILKLPPAERNGIPLEREGRYPSAYDPKRKGYTTERIPSIDDGIPDAPEPEETPVMTHESFR